MKTFKAHHFALIQWSVDKKVKKVNPQISLALYCRMMSTTLHKSKRKVSNVEPSAKQINKLILYSLRFTVNSCKLTKKKAVTPMTAFCS